MTRDYEQMLIKSEARLNRMETKLADHLLDGHKGKSRGKPITSCHDCNLYRDGIITGKLNIATIKLRLKDQQ